MTVLRSREIAPLQSLVKTLTKRVIEPSTPARAHEPLTHKSSFSETVSSDPNPTNNMGLGPVSESVSGVAPRRRSLRLSSKSNPDEGSSIVHVSDVSVSVSGGRRKRKSVAGENRSEDEVENVVKIEDGVSNDSGCDFGEEKIRVLEGKERIKKPKDGKTSSRKANKEENVDAKKAKGKRKLDVDVGLSNLDLDDDDENNGAKQFLNLRSGKRVVKRRIDEGVESEGDKSVCGSEEGGDDIKVETLLIDGCGVETPSCSLTVGRRRLSSEEEGKEKVVKDDNGVDQVEMGLETSNAGNSVDNAGVNGKGTVKGRKRFSQADKGKGKMVESNWFSNANDSVGTVGLDLESEGKNLLKNAVMESVHLLEDVALEVESQVLEASLRVDDSKTSDPRERFRNVARKNASRFAHFASAEEDESSPSDQAEEAMPPGEVNEEVEDWPGPFSTAMKIINDRAVNINVQQEVPSSHKVKQADILWVPKKTQDCKSSNRLPPSLQEKCLEFLVKHADAIASLDNVPDVLRHKLSQMLCDSRRMSSHIFNILVCGSPIEVRIKDCSWLTEEEFTKSFEGCDTSNLMVLQLDQCGRCLPDYVVRTTLAQSSNSLPALTTISLKGGCRLSDAGLSSLVSSAPALRSVNLGQCSLLTSTGIDTLADALGSILRELYIDDCQSIDAMLVLPALKKLEHLEVLSLAGIETVSDNFIRKFMFVCGRNMKELVLTDCVKLTDSSLKVIAETCPGLRALHLANLCKLTDSAIGYLSNNCLQIQTLKLRRNAFSDEAIAAYVETSGEFLKELSLNNVKKVGHNTALSLARRSRNLQSLDLSFCRNMTDEALGLIVDSCLSLSLLKLFGCTQVSNVFLDGHSNTQVKIIGMKMTPILEHLMVPHPQEGPLHYSSVCSST